MNVELLAVIEAIENEIKEQKFGIAQYIGESDWNKANNQQWYIAGLEKALKLAKAGMASEQPEKGARNE